MAASVVKCGFGTLLKKAGTTIAEVTSISVDGLERGEIKVSHMESPNYSHEYIGQSLTEPGEITAELNFLPGNATQKDLLTELFGGTADTWTIVWSDSSVTWTFTAFVKSFTPSAAIESQLTASITLKVTTAPTFPA